MKSEIEIANEVIAGKWSFGTDRENKLRAAGYDYNAIQAIVNQIIKTGKPIGELTIDAEKYGGYVVTVKR